MSGGLVGLLDDIAAFAKLAAASIDDVGAAAGRASAKTAGLVVDDAAVTPAYVRGLAAKRELPVIRRIATGSLRNKVLIILPAALALSQFAPILVEIILMFGGSYLCFEGAEKIHHRLAPHGAHDSETEVLPAAAIGPEQEEATIKGAVRTDFILSAEIMVVALKEVIDEGLLSRAVMITGVVYGAVALIVKMDDVGLNLAQRSNEATQRVGRAMVSGMPKLLAALTVIGTAAMVWVGGHILLVGTDELGWHGPYEFVHSLEERVHDVAGIGGVLSWSVNTLASALIGLAVGFLLVTVISRVKGDDHASAANH